MAIVPTRRTLTNQAPVHVINLGYATFDTGSTNQLFIESRAESAVILLTNHDIGIGFLPPHAPTKNMTSVISASEARKHPKTFAYMMQWETDDVAAEIDCEETYLLPLLKLVFMKNDDFLLYSSKVGVKLSWLSQCERVEGFQSPYAKGIVRYLTNSAYGEHPNKYLGAVGFFKSLDGNKGIGFKFQLNDPSSTNLATYLDPMLRSFQFTVDNVDDREAITALIRDAGIPQPKQVPQDEE